MNRPATWPERCLAGALPAGPQHGKGCLCLVSALAAALGHGAAWSGGGSAVGTVNASG